MPQSTLVVPDYDTINTQKLTKGVGVVPVPPATTIGGSVNGVICGNGIVMYHTNSTMTGSAASQPLTIPKAHRFIRAEFQMTNSSNAPDATATTILLKRIDPYINPPGTTGGNQITLFSTNGAQAVDSVVFLGGTGYEADAGTYIITGTGTNTDILYVRFYVQFIL